VVILTTNPETARDSETARNRAGRSEGGEMYLRVIGGRTHLEHMIGPSSTEKCDLDHGG
jgi:hypothetical protein